MIVFYRFRKILKNSKIPKQNIIIIQNFGFSDFPVLYGKAFSNSEIIETEYIHLKKKKIKNLSTRTCTKNKKRAFAHVMWSSAIGGWAKRKLTQQREPTSQEMGN